MISRDVYGSRTLGLDEIKERTEDLLGVEFVGHSSDFRGGDYWRAKGPGQESMTIQLNQPDPEEPEDLIESGSPEYPTLLLVHLTERGDELRALLSAIDGLEFLRRRP